MYYNVYRPLELCGLLLSSHKFDRFHMEWRGSFDLNLGAKYCTSNAIYRVILPVI